MKALVSVIIVNYNTEKLLEECIKSVFEQVNDIQFEIIVIDNDSEKGSLSTLIDSFPLVNFNLLNQNLGFGIANNWGASFAKGEYLFFLNPDTILINDAITILHTYMEEHPNVGVCGGNLHREDMSPAVSYHILDFYNREYRILFNKKWELGFNHTDKPKTVNTVMGADLFVRKKLFEELKGFDDDFFMYFEEVEFCDRVRRAGYMIMSVPEAKIIHLEGGSAENKNEELNKWSYREHWYSKFVYFSKAKGKFKTKILYLANILKLKLAILYFSIRKNNEKLIYWNLKKQVVENTFERYETFLKKRK